MANGKLLGAQFPVTLEKSDFCGAKTGWLMMDRELRKLSNRGWTAGQAADSVSPPFWL